MRITLPVNATACILALTPIRANSAQPASRQTESPTETLADYRHVDVSPAAPLTTQEADHIKELIRRLADVDRPAYGYTLTKRFSRFAPIPAASTYFLGVSGDDPEIREPAALAELVRLGPAALPFLLESLTDTTLTQYRLTFPQNPRGFGRDERRIRYDPYLDRNPMNERENSILGERPKTDPKVKRGEVSYVVRIGDLCFVAIGQITNRDYRLISANGRYDANVIRSVEHGEIAKKLRKVWEVGDCRQGLFDHLMIDFRTRSGHSSARQADAALRLLFYFPDVATPIVAERIRLLNVESPDNGERIETNGVIDSVLIEKVAFSTDPVIRRELVRVMRTSSGILTFCASVPRASETNLDECWDRFREFDDKSPSHSPSFKWLVLASFNQYGGDGLVPFASRMLNDTSETTKDGKPHRCCDVAADLIARHVDGIDFDLDAPLDVRTKKIREITTKLERPKD
ncbi:MAG: hypothetical protein H6819_08860 [Phycisphaerales bacterium]|nr:hypothetical protein [Phycisphaerales bacterium]MCB9855661.1 hypothetical protein [Phycisphaerales bacterium]MCB9862557.1 hypothetical protein [Phycisphaerales bacterium]